MSILNEEKIKELAKNIEQAKKELKELNELSRARLNLHYISKKLLTWSILMVIELFFLIAILAALPSEIGSIATLFVFLVGFIMFCTTGAINTACVNWCKEDKTRNNSFQEMLFGAFLYRSNLSYRKKELEEKYGPDDLKEKISRRLLIVEMFGTDYLNRSLEECLYEDKYLYYLRKNAAKKIKSLQSFLPAANRYFESRTQYQAKTHDWAVAGGIAEGLGGAAIGLATAIDTERKNIASRERAKEIRANATEMVSQLSDFQADLLLACAELGALFEEFSECIDYDFDAKKFLSETIEAKGIYVEGKWSLDVDLVQNSINIDANHFTDGIVLVEVEEENRVIGRGFWMPFGYQSWGDILEHSNLLGFKEGKASAASCYAVDEKIEFSKTKTYNIKVTPLILWSVNKRKMENRLAKIEIQLKNIQRIQDTAIRNTIVNMG